jgi:hypothetical protein
MTPECSEATIQNRSRYCIAVTNRDDLTRYLSFSKVTAVETCTAQLRAEGPKPKAWTGTSPVNYEQTLSAW